MTDETKVSAIPLGNKVLVKFDPVEEAATESGIIIHTASTKEREYLAQTRGTVVAIGPEAWVDVETNLDLPWKHLIEVGTRVLFARYSGVKVEDSDDSDRVMNDHDIIAVLEHE